MIINSKLSDEALLKAIYRAASEYSNLIGNSYLIIGKSKNTNYFYFQCFFEKKHFMHLLGIDSANMNASDIDIVVILDELSAKDIQTYNDMLNTLPHRELICGFLSDKNDIMNWEP